MTPSDRERSLARAQQVERELRGWPDDDQAEAHEHDAATPELVETGDHGAATPITEDERLSDVQIISARRPANDALAVDTCPAAAPGELAAGHVPAELEPAAPPPPPPPPPASLPAAAPEPEDDRRSTRAPTNGHARPRLSDEHLAHLRTSGLTDETLELAGLYTEHAAHRLAKLLKRRSYSPDCGSAIVFPFLAPGASVPHAFRIKPERPREGGGKYDQEYGIQLVYFPPRARLGDWYRDAQRTLYIGEGEKKGLALDQLGYACVALTGCFNFLDPKRDKNGADRFDPQITEHVVLADREIVLVLDADVATNPNVKKAMGRLAKLLYAGGARHVLKTWSDVEGAKGVDDHLALCGEQATRAMLARTKTVRRTHASRLLETTLVASSAGVEAEVSREPDAQQQPQKRPELQLSVNWAEVAAAAIRILAADRERRVYQRGKQLVHVTRETFESTIVAMPPGAPYIRVMRPLVLGEVLTSIASIVEVSISERGEDIVPKAPPSWLTRLLCERGEWSGVPPLAAAVEDPVLRPDGTVLVQPGYDAATGLLYEPSSTVSVPDAPSRDDAVAARKLLESVVCDFPFAAGAHRSGWLAFVLTLVARYAFKGATPLFLHDASARGSGKTMLAHLAAIIATGHVAAKRQYPRDDDAEMRKLVTTIAMMGLRCVLLDNVIGELGGSVLCDVLTSTEWGDRILGLNASYDGPWLTVLSATGNNVRLGPDMDRRVQHIRLEPQVESPEKRTDFEQPNLIRWVRDERKQLLAAALTILRAYAVAGRPPVKYEPWGSYEDWSEAVRAPLVWSGAPDPAGAREGLVAAASADDAASRLVRGWHQLTTVHGALATGRALRIIYPDVGPHDLDVNRDPHPLLREALEELHPQPHGRHISAGALGRLLSAHRGRVFGGLVLGSRLNEGSTQWSAVRVGTDAAASP